LREILHQNMCTVNGAQKNGAGEDDRPLTSSVRYAVISDSKATRLGITRVQPFC
jgi:hypothetical protein